MGQVYPIIKMFAHIYFSGFSLIAHILCKSMRHNDMHIFMKPLSSRGVTQCRCLCTERLNGVILANLYRGHSTPFKDETSDWAISFQRESQSLLISLLPRLQMPRQVISNVLSQESQSGEDRNGPSGKRTALADSSVGIVDGVRATRPA